ncbi:MAG TPA: hypothetical protein VFD76_02495 [Gemmatimonadales bacterium]|jgi:hypothetical protein|nr:hypothetical protein [Gemmatimonadales bacterium]
MFGIPEWAIGVGFIVLVTSLAKAFSRGADSGAGGLPRPRKASLRDLTRGLDDIEQRLRAVEEAQRQLGGGGGEELQTRLSEVEERLDFAERLLAKQRDGERAIPPKT